MTSLHVLLHYFHYKFSGNVFVENVFTACDGAVQKVSNFSETITEST